ncbi:MAG: hypothetical protein FWG29_01860 [Treponema sp.]|nr:hypothetical protein [Treponema sp.]
MNISNNHQDWRVFHFMVSFGKNSRNVSVASTDKEEAKALILASFDNVTGVREKRKGA